VDELLEEELLEEEDELLELEVDEVELLLEELDEVDPPEDDELELVPMPPLVHPCRAKAPAATKIKAIFLISTTLFN